MRLAINFERVDPNRGGAETYVADLCRWLVRGGNEVDLYANSWREGVLPAQVRFHRVPITGSSRNDRIWSFAENSEKALRDTAYDCTIGLINTWYCDILIPQGGVHRASLDYNANRFPAGWRRSLYRVLKRLNPKFRLYEDIERSQYDPLQPRRFVAVSRMVQEHLRRYHRVSLERTRVIPNAIDPARLAVADPAGVRHDFRTRHGLSNDDLVALFVGHNFRLKGLPALLSALSYRAQQDHTARPVHVVVCGGGRLGSMRGLVKQLNLTKTVHLIGFEPSIAACYHASDFLVLPTYYDPCSLVVFEALACGLPVVTTACNGAGELITQGREGFVIESPNDRDALIEALDALANDRRRRDMAAHARILGAQQSFENHVNKLLAVCAEVADQKQRANPHRPVASLIPASVPQ
jgi:UDP-glucose:(heptosyl)LPS alpha-1,3-glucosyltransferase